MAATLFGMRGRVALVRITKPPVNSLGLAVRKGLMDGLDAAEKSNAGAVVLVGDGSTFPAGADIAEFATGGHMTQPVLGNVIERVSALGMHSVAAVHGTALGGGMELTLACHWRLMHKHAQFGLPEVHLGLLPGAGGTQRLPRLIGCEAAIKMMTSGAMISAKKALAAGLADEVVPSTAASPSEDMVERAVAFCEEKLIGQPIDPLRVVAARKVTEPSDDFFATVRKGVVAKSRGEVAPGVIVDAVEAAVGAESFEAGLGAEVNLFMDLAGGSQARAMQQVFNSERKISKIEGLPSAIQPAKVNAAAVVGAGTMGGGIAMCFAEAGIPVTVIDAQEDALTRGLGLIRKNWEASAKKGKLTLEQVEARMALVRGATSYDDVGVAAADVVVEAAFERMSVKKVRHLPAILSLTQTRLKSVCALRLCFHRYSSGLFLCLCLFHRAHHRATPCVCAGYLCCSGHPCKAWVPPSYQHVHTQHR